jgi:hypothetical protein
MHEALESSSSYALSHSRIAASAPDLVETFSTKAGQKQWMGEIGLVR